MTRKHKQLLDFIAAYQDNHHGVTPSFEEMMDGLGLASKSRIHSLLNRMEEEGLIRRLRNRARAIEIIKDPSKSRALSMFHGATNEDLAIEAQRRGLVLGRFVISKVSGKRGFAQIHV